MILKVLASINRASKSVVRSELNAAIKNPAQLAQVKHEIFRTMAKNAPVITLGNMLAGMLFVVAFLGSSQSWKAMGWYVCFLAVVSLTINRPLKSGDCGERSKDWLRRTEIPTLFLIAATWLALPLLMFGEAGIYQRLMLIALPFALIGVVATYMSALSRSAIAFNIVVSAGSVLTYIVHWHPANLSLIGLLILYSIFMSAMNYSNSRFIAERFLNGFELENSNQTVSMLLQEYEDDGHEWLWETDEQFNFTAISKKFCELTGLGEDRIANLNLRHMRQEEASEGLNNSRNGNGLMVRNIEAMQSFKNVTVSPLKKTGEPVWWHLSGRPFFDSENKFLGYRGVARDVTKQVRNEHHISALAMSDSLTKLPNRESFRQELAEVMNKVAVNKERAALFMLDLDKFKHINDTLGHPAGDELLVRVSERLNSHCANARVISRLGGDEFAILFENVGNARDVDLLIERVRKVFKTQFNVSGRQLGVNSSVGLAIAPDHGTYDEELVKNADLAMYRAKANVGDTFHMFDAQMDLQLRERHKLAQELQSALRNDELELLYQPLVALRSGEVVGYEALIRWDNPRIGEVKPQMFIPIAEENGLIIDIGKWVIRKACQEASSWNNDCRVAVNLSPKQFVGVQLETVVALALAENNLRPSRLELEITETSLLANGEATLETLNNLRKLGISVALDDFGTGYSSLSYLTKFPFDKIKIDRSFLERDVLDEDNTAVIRAMLGLAKTLNLRTTVEGVEHQHQLDFLRKVGCDELQGFLFSRPLKPEKLRSVYHDSEAEPVRVQIRG